MLCVLPILRYILIRYLTHGILFNSHFIDDATEPWRAQRARHKVTQLMAEPFHEKCNERCWQVCQTMPKSVLGPGCPGRNLSEKGFGAIL